MPPLDATLATPRRVLLMGMGVANRAVAGALVRRGHLVTVLDDRPDDTVRMACEELGITLLGADADLDGLVAGAELVVPTPGLPERHRVFAAADDRGVPVVSELDLAAVWDDRPVVAVTGTNGKTTVVELAVAAAAAAGTRAVAAGNTDVPMVTAIDDPATELFVVEASSFRLARAGRFAPRVGTWLNFAPDHLDVHRDLAAYEAAKARLFAMVAADGTVVANAADSVVMQHVPSDRSVVTFGPGGDYHRDGDDLVGPDGVFTTADRLWRALPHDVEAVLAVAASLAPVGIGTAAVAAAATGFAPLAHRVSPVGTLDGQTYYDDSKATTPHATLAALRAFEQVVLIAGGRNKGIDLGVLASGAEHLRAVVAIGDAAPDVERAFTGIVAVETATDMVDAVVRARRLAAGGAPVLLSPGCASFDWYRNYGERGDHFAAVVAELGTR